MRSARFAQPSVKPSSDDPPGPSHRTYQGGLLKYVVDKVDVNVYTAETEALLRRYGGIPAGCEPAPAGCVGEPID